MEENALLLPPLLIVVPGRISALFIERIVHPGKDNTGLIRVAATDVLSGVSVIAINVYTAKVVCPGALSIAIALARRLMGQTV